MEILILGTEKLSSKAFESSGGDEGGRGRRRYSPMQLRDSI